MKTVLQIDDNYTTILDIFLGHDACVVVMHFKEDLVMLNVKMSNRLTKVVAALCLGCLVCGNSHVLAQSIRSISRIQNTYFTYGVSGNILTKTVNGNKKRYTYNVLNQLVQVQHADGSIAHLKMDYDALGDMLHDTLGNGYHYNLLGQLVEFDNQATGAKANYQYYANGLRANKKFAGKFAVAPILYYRSFAL